LRDLGKILRYAMLTQRILGRLKWLGLDIHLYYLIREGPLAHDMNRPELTAEFSSSVLTQDDVPAVAALSTWATLENVQGRFDKGHLCVLLKHEEHIAGYTWADFVEINDTTCNYELQPGEAYLYDAFIAPDYRGQALAPYMRFECYEHLRHADRYTFYSLSDYFNKPAIRFKQKLNADIIRLYLHIRLGTHEVGHWILKDYE